MTRPDTAIFRSLREAGRALSAPLAAMGCGLLVCSIIVFLSGTHPWDFLAVTWKGSWGSGQAVAATLGKTTPLLLTGLAVSIAYQAGFLNIGCEGQLTLGALCAATLAALDLPLPRFVLVPCLALAGACTGALWAYPACLLKQRRGVHEVITTLLLNYVAIHLAQFLVLGPLGDGSAMGRTPEIPSKAALDPLWESGALGVTAAPPAALLLALGVQFWKSRTVWGYEATMTGSNPAAALCAGISTDRLQRRLFLLSGAFAGLAGSLEILAVHHRFYNAFSPGYGFDGITVAFLVNAAPGWLWLSSLLLAGLRSADKWLQILLGVSPNIIVVIQAVLLLAAASQGRLRERAAALFERVRRKPGGSSFPAEGRAP